MKFCKDCVFVKTRLEGEEVTTANSFCVNPSVAPVYMSLVTSEDCTPIIFCNTARLPGSACGVEGTHYRSQWDESSEL